ncbi:sulfatase-like hydrolase/transferase [Lentisphaera marina]|uniref:sulfatase-like hydrolase/transferase n=1 Tax=Lentisphaera marina TaxID=1111041 RepID=UPI002364FDC2|nr:sulfatase-like hydrolase/transferase [Lentisphaera marina]MDD7986427.1 sulfatase-like hydrolase/transferase [Lentisphaera marina]
MKIFSILFALACLSLGAEQIQNKPNLIVIMADDLGYKDVGYNGCTDIPTPHIDALAKSGVQFSSGYSAYSVCGPSRAGFITGRYQQRFGSERNPQYRPEDPNMGVPKSEKTIAEVLKPLGYSSKIIGKWHLGAHKETHHPLNRGFDEFYGHLGGSHYYFQKEMKFKDSYKLTKDKEEIQQMRTWILDDHTPVQFEKHLTEEFTDQALDFIERHQEKPFFLFMSYNAPHTPLQPAKKDLERVSHIQDKQRQLYAGLVVGLDDGVGQIMKKLRDCQLEENTLVFFMSDNGGKEKWGADNGILRKDKGSSYEGGWRVPFLLKWKGVTSPSIYDQPVNSLDVLATIADLSGAALDPEKPLDGVNLIPYVTGAKQGSPHKAIFLRGGGSEGSYAVRMGDYKLITYNGGTCHQMFNLKDDISEEKNIIKSFPERFTEIDNVRAEWSKGLIEPVYLGLEHTQKFKENNKKK